MGGVLIRCIILYQKHSSKRCRGACIYEPSCSQYAMQATEKHGPAKGSRLAIRRLLRCRPSYPGGYDPVD